MNTVFAKKTKKISALLILLVLFPHALCSACRFRALANENRYVFHQAFKPPEKGCSLYIDLDKCVMKVFRDGKLYKSYPVSGGKNTTPSPVGKWKIVSIASWGKGFGGCWLGLNVPWGTYGIHGTLRPDIIGKSNVSGGCIRMKNRDVEEVKKLVSYGCLVYIKQDTLPFRVMQNGMVGSDVMNAQLLLRDMGFYSGGIDGKYGNMLDKAVRDFQKAHGIPVDGIIGFQTYNLMRGSLE